MTVYVVILYSASLQKLLCIFVRGFLQVSWKVPHNTLHTRKARIARFALQDLEEPNKNVAVDIFLIRWRKPCEKRRTACKSRKENKINMWIS